MQAYSNLMTLVAYKNRVELVKNALQSQSTMTNFSSATASLSNELTNMKTKALDILHILLPAEASNNNIDELEKKVNQHIAQYKQYVVNLSGYNMQGIFLDAFDKERTAQNAQIDKFLGTFVEKVIGTVANDTVFTEKLSKDVLDALAEAVHGANTNIRFTSTYRMSGTKVNDLRSYNLSPSQRAGVLKLINQSNRNGETPTASFDNNTITLSWPDIIESMTPEQAKVLGKDECERRSGLVKDVILARIGQDGRLQELASGIIDYMLRIDPYLFFVGKNTSKASGVLGELQALIYIAIFFGGLDNPKQVLSKFGSEIRYNATELMGSSKKQAHRDIIVNGLGIQVKNKVADLLQSGQTTVGFRQRSLSTFFDDLGLPDDIRNIYENFYGMLAFNIPYEVKDETYVEDAVKSTPRKEEFLTTRDTLAGYKITVNKLLSVYAATLMYLDTTQGISDEDSNTLFLISGSAVMTAYTIVKKLLQQLSSQLQDFQVNVLTDKSNAPYTIVDRMNQITSGGTSLENYRKIISGEGSNKSYSEAVLQSIKLNATYTFKFHFD